MAALGQQMRRVGRLDLRDLTERRLATTAMLLFVVAGPPAVWYLPGPGFNWQRCLGLATIAMAAAVAWLARRANPAAGTAILILALAAVGAGAAFAVPEATFALMVLAVAVASILPSPIVPLATGLGCAGLYALIHFMVLPQPYPEVTIPGLALAGGILSLSARSSMEIMGWFWRRHDQTLRLAEDLRDRQGQLNRTVKALDLAYRLLQHTNHQLAEVQEQALEAQRQKERFTANISHELRTPLNLILGFSEVMYMSPEVYGEVNWSKPLRRDVTRIYEASRHLSQLVDDVLDLSRVQVERLPLRKEANDVGQIVREAADTVAGLLRGQGVRLSVQIEPGMPPVAFDATRIRQVLVNLLTNAIRFTDEGEIAVRVRQAAPVGALVTPVGALGAPGMADEAAVEEAQGDQILVSVSDTGAGIPAAELQAVFNEFHQAEAAVRRQGRGVGLGLAISRKLVQMHGGRIWAESETGKGSTFYFTLPTDGTTAPNATLRMGQPLPLPKDRYGDYVLLLNSEADTASMLQRHLEGYRVVTADAWYDDLELAGVPPRAAVCNLSPRAVVSLQGALPSVSIPDDVPVLFCCIPSAAWRIEHLGVRASLQKPVRRQELLSLLDGLGGSDDVLVVDDDRGFVQLVVRWLEADGRRVRFAYDGEDGLEQMRRDPPRAVLLDLRMPGVSGVDVLSEMRADPALRDIPVAVLTGTDADDDPTMARARVIGLLQRDGWGLSDTLDSVAELLRFARPSRVTSSPATPESLADRPG
ncbi:MAG: hybrid sensor histidine kinase/response regulator [Anaerolineae bacterium]